MSPAGLQWVMNAYLLALASCVTVGGRLSELVGRGRMFRIGAATFVAASAACGLADSETWLILARAVQGLGAAAMIPTTMASIVDAFDVQERGRAIGIYGGISMISLALGPLAGGLLTQGVTWRAVFWINLPLGLAMLAVAARSLPRDAPERDAAMDWPGALTLVSGLVMVVLALMQSQQWGWGSTATIVLLTGGVALIAAFGLVETRARFPLVALGLFKSRNFSVGNTVLALVQYALAGMSVFGAIYVQELLGFGPIAASLSFLPLTVPLLLLAPWAGQVYDRIGPRALVGCGAGLLGVALVWIAAVLGKLEFAWLVPALALGGIGIALTMGPAGTDAFNAAPAALRGQASGVMGAMRQVGGTVGVAIMGTAVGSVQRDRLIDYAHKVGATAADRTHFDAVVAAAHGDPAVLRRLPIATLDALRDSLVSGISTAYYIAAGVLLAAALLGGLSLRRVRAADATPAGFMAPLKRRQAACQRSLKLRDEQRALSRRRRLAAAESVVACRGFHSASVEEGAREAGP